MGDKKSEKERGKLFNHIITFKVKTIISLFENGFLSHTIYLEYNFVPSTLPSSSSCTSFYITLFLPLIKKEQASEKEITTKYGKIKYNKKKLSYWSWTQQLTRRKRVPRTDTRDRDPVFLTLRSARNLKLKAITHMKRI